MITHKVQLDILKRLLFNPRSHFADLNKTGLSSDHFTFHINKLIEEDLVEKSDNLYNLTPKGTEFAGRLDISSNRLVLQPKVSVMVYISRKKHGKKEVLLGERLMDPIKGLVSYHTLKVGIEETLTQSAKRCLLEETGLTGNMIFAGVYQYTHYKNGKLVEATVINCFRTSNLTGKIKYTTTTVKNFWIALQDVSNLKNLYPGFTELSALLNSHKIFFKEIAVRD